MLHMPVIDHICGSKHWTKHAFHSKTSHLLSLESISCLTPDSRARKITLSNLRLTPLDAVSHDLRYPAVRPSRDPPNRPWKTEGVARRNRKPSCNWRFGSSRPWRCFGGDNGREFPRCHYQKITGLLHVRTCRRGVPVVTLCALRDLVEKNIVREELSDVAVDIMGKH